MDGGVDLQVLATRESEQTEWKANVADVEDVVAAITAFANDISNLGGGYVVCGAREKRAEHGFQSVEMVGLDSSRLQEVEGRVISLCRDRVDPSLHPVVREIETSDPAKRVLIFIVPASRRAHCFRTRDDSGKYYVRVSRQTIEARDGVLRELLALKGEIEPWDRRACPTATVNDLDLIVLRDALQRMGVFDPSRGVDYYFSDTTQLSPFVPSLCVREPLTHVLRPRNFTVLLFGSDVQRHIAGAFAVFSIYPGKDRSEPYAERREIAGPLLQQARTLVELLNVQSFVVFDKTDASAPNAVKYLSVLCMKR